jgi:UDP-galactopyranose mutase
MDQLQVILGAGLAGLSAAYHLKERAVIYEASPTVGGVARSIEIEGFTFDRAIHILYTRDEYAATLIRKCLQHNFSEQERSAWVYAHGRYIPYPYQGHLGHLPDDVRQANIMGLLEARYESHPNEPNNFEEWLLSVFGRGITNDFMLPFNRKLWATDLRKMNFQWIADRVLLPDLDALLRGAFSQAPSQLGPNAFFWYPRTGGIQTLSDALASEINDINTTCRCIGIDIMRRIAYFDAALPRSFETLISTIPLPELLRLIHPIPKEVEDAAAQLRSNEVITVNLGIDRADISDKHWVYFPQSNYEFHRISFPSNFSRDLAPRFTSSLSVEYSRSVERPLEMHGIVRRTINALQEIGILHSSDRILASQVERISPAYVIPTLESERGKETVHRYLNAHGIYSCGRFGSWAYLNMDQAILEGKRAAEFAMNARNTATSKLETI